MTFLQNLWRDLVDKKLWPVAALLVLAAVAVPMLVGSGSSSEDVAAVPVPATPAPAGIGEISVDVPDTTKQHARGGSSRDPFKALVYAKAVKAAAVTAGAGAVPAAGSAKVAPSASVPSGRPTTTEENEKTAAAANAAAAGTTPKATTTTTTKLFEYAIALETRRSGKVVSDKTVRAISYVPSASYPLLTFLGMKKQGTVATFLVRDDVEVSGSDRVCRPSRTTCRFVELTSGKSVLIAKIPSAASQSPRHFRITMGDVSVVEVSKKPSAADAVSRAFRNVPSIKGNAISAVTVRTATTG